MLPVVQEDGLVTAMADKENCHSHSKLLHPSVRLYVMDREKRLYLFRDPHRSEAKAEEWSVAAEGHVIYGESIIEALFRVASECAGLRNFNPLLLGTYVYDSDCDRELVTSFAAIGRFDLPVGENRQWWQMQEIEKNMMSGVFPRKFISEMKMFKTRILSML